MNNNLGVDESYVAIMDTVNIAGWIHNSANICMADDCKAMVRLLDFTWHHCRLCGLLICKKCISAEKMIVPQISSTEAVKVCKDCFHDSHEVLNVPIQPVDVIPSFVESKVLEPLVPLVDSAVDIVGLVEDSWDIVEQLYGGVKSLELDSSVIQSVASVVTSVAVDLFPVLLDIGRRSHLLASQLQLV